MQFIDFCRAHGLIVDHVVGGTWQRVATTDHPRKKNGAYKLMGNAGWVQNHATMVEPQAWRSDEPQTVAQQQQVVKQAAEFDRRMREGWERAAGKAQKLIDAAKQGEHNYLTMKGFPEARGLVTARELVIPMRHWRTNALVGAQVITWLPGVRKYEKKMLPGMRAKGAVFKLGGKHATRTWLVEGFATGLSVEAALRMRRLSDAVLVCFSDGNLIHVAKQLEGDMAVFADNDESGAGERAAKAAGLPYCMAPTVGHDANDMHAKAGLFHVAALMARVPHRVADPVP